ncbi:protein EDS1L-like [Rutidosis leptorrhynchoides]|uniref:protein EDS1L-like n=1 Tax=Rutidosis leptorrhynchoides TaxID=125765 RepID=UPI003A992F52
MMGQRLGERLEISETLIIKACSLALKSHKSNSNTGFITKESGTEETVIAFGGSWSEQDFYSHKPFGEAKIDVSLFPSLKSVGNNELATINQGFFRKFQSILKIPSFQAEVEKAIKKGKSIIFTGHSSGGPVAILASIWYLEKYTRSNGQKECKCVTFGSPLVGNRIFTHALNRQNWARFFIHFVVRYDIVPRITLAPLSSIENELSKILDFFNPKSRNFQNQNVQNSPEASSFFMKVLKNAASVTSHSACNLMGSTNSLLDIVSNFVELSPYRPSGTYIFCTGNGKMVCVENPNAVLQILFYCSQPADAAEVKDAASRSLFMDYNDELAESLIGMQDVVYMDDKMEIPLSSNGNISSDMASVNTALKDLGLSTRARLCLQAAQAFENQKLQNQTMIDLKKQNIIKTLDSITDYKKACTDRKIGYYDAFKIQKGNEDFQANVHRLELAGIWDEIVEMLKRYELPDGFESRVEWIKLGTKFRKLVEPLDIANYYRHSKDEDTGTYLRDGGRPKRYKYTQRWFEHAHKLNEGSSSETIFWAKVEEMRRKPFETTKEQIVGFENEVSEQVEKEALGKDIFLERSTFVEWWKSLPEKHKTESCLKAHFGNFTR